MNVLFEIWLAFLTGFFSSFGHCVGMCGPLVSAFTLAGSSQTVSPAGAWWRLKPQLCYHAGRILTYTFLGMLAGGSSSLIGVLGSGSVSRGVMEIVGGSLMLMAGFWTLPVWPPFLTRWFLRLQIKNHFITGILLGFLPCGLVYAMLAKALAVSQPVTSSGVMLAFGLGTVPALLIVGIMAQWVTARLRKQVSWLAFFLMVAWAVFTIAQGVRHWHEGPHSHHHHSHSG